MTFGHRLFEKNHASFGEHSPGCTHITSVTNRHHPGVHLLAQTAKVSESVLLVVERVSDREREERET